ncbi:MAG: hypothetical protein ACTSQL_00910 [Promethearchaeota archaeon]
MSNSNGIVKTSYEKRLNFTATGVLLIWIIIIIFGIFSLINTVLRFNLPFVWSLSYENPLFYIVFIIGVFSSRNVSISLINRFKQKRWIEPSKFIKGILIQLITATIASILTVIFYKANNFTEFFSLFFSFAFLFSIVYIGFCLRYYRYDLPERENFRYPSQRGHY